MAESFGAGGPSGSSGVLSSTMRSIVRQTGDPQDHEQRRVEDMVDLSPMAAQRQQAQESVQPAESSDQLRNPGGQPSTLERAQANAKADEAEAAAREAARESAPTADINQPVNIGLAAAIAIGSPQMVDRYDVNGDERLDQRERGRAIDSVTSQEGNTQAPSGKMFRSGQGEDMVGGSGEGEAYFAEMEAKKAASAQQRAEAEVKAEQARADRLAALEEQQARSATASSAPMPGADRAYARSEGLDAEPRVAPQNLKA